MKTKKKVVAKPKADQKDAIYISLRALHESLDAAGRSDVSDGFVIALACAASSAKTTVTKLEFLVVLGRMLDELAKGEIESRLDGIP